ncbi:sigma-70 family RNA polymerase sigma factor [Flavobacterium sp. LPB0248]|uniref:sigma-70 family RNA polymerase sigma factor n=1 Tax=Flavobacterium sp. LPB0248 TaxID=2614441 RepID=UPI0015A68FEA|nr:sigma-70 family RNA polymerase sigma factor [Flavobacterium sp. LPB0248]QLC67143.1 sigma-70 family RNA polymerase sigma factor [Flavobacterium sp. LPB0248]
MLNYKDFKTFEALYKDHFIFFSLVSFNIVKDKDVAKDIVQDFFTYLWEKEESLNFTISFKAYGTKAIKNLSLQYLEKNKTVSLQNTKIATPKSEEPTAFENIEEDKKPKIQTLIDKIPQSRREIFISHVVEGLSYQEIAEDNNISVNTVKTQMKRAYASLRESQNISQLKFILYFIWLIK